MAKFVQIRYLLTYKPLPRDSHYLYIGKYIPRTYVSICVQLF